jgi:hypothetical protein
VVHAADRAAGVPVKHEQIDEANGITGSQALDLGERLGPSVGAVETDDEQLDGTARDGGCAVAR